MLASVVAADGSSTAVGCCCLASRVWLLSPRVDKSQGLWLRPSQLMNGEQIIPEQEKSSQEEQGNKMRFVLTASATGSKP